MNPKCKDKIRIEEAIAGNNSFFFRGEILIFIESLILLVTSNHRIEIQAILVHGTMIFID
ncbi:MAG: hypothetical protein CVU00_03540 [Bacteroidetes bacterium HGW-Bacteroidetes-17]|nr:MAG: hypothetical protein CVU00_03540 [Bacteroidetes bacterium HGW-Bacteroidetes-17]